MHSDLDLRLSAITRAPVANLHHFALSLRSLTGCILLRQSLISDGNIILDLGFFFCTPTFSGTQPERKTMGRYIRLSSREERSPHVRRCDTLVSVSGYMLYAKLRFSGICDVYGGLLFTDRCGLRYRPHSCLFG
jgi:hypothetical protein